MRTCGTLTWSLLLPFSLAFVSCDTPATPVVTQNPFDRYTNVVVDVALRNKALAGDPGRFWQRVSEQSLDELEAMRLLNDRAAEEAVLQRLGKGTVEPQVTDLIQRVRSDVAACGTEVATSAFRVCVENVEARYLATEDVGGLYVTSMLKGASRLIEHSGGRFISAAHVQRLPTSAGEWRILYAQSGETAESPPDAGSMWSAGEATASIFAGMTLMGGAWAWLGAQVGGAIGSIPLGSLTIPGGVIGGAAGGVIGGIGGAYTGWSVYGQTTRQRWANAASQWCSDQFYGIYSRHEKYETLCDDATPKWEVWDTLTLSTRSETKETRIKKPIVFI